MASLPTAAEVSRFLDDLVGNERFADYPTAMNGLQLDHEGPVRHIAAAVDVSTRAIEEAIGHEANFLLAHHGMFWGGLQPIRGLAYERMRRLISHDIAVFASHLPLDQHPEFGNNALLASALDLEPTGGFAAFRGMPIGVRGECSLPTGELVDRVTRFVAEFGGTVRTVGPTAERMTRRWGLCTGSGVSSETLAEARAAGIDTVISGEGPHHVTVEAEESGICVIFGGHYATETLGVQALARVAADHFGLPWTFLHAPTGS